ncbi:hypothetical protein D9M71_740700 [compost metagenome]
MHAIGVGHGVGLLAQFQQATGNSPGHVEKCQIANLARSVAQALGHLTAQGVEDFRVLARQFAKLFVADFGHFAFGLGAYPGTALLLAINGLEQA